MAPDAPAHNTAPTFADKAEGRRNNYDVLRFAFATLVIFSHCYPLLYGPGHKDFYVNVSVCRFYRAAP